VNARKKQPRAFNLRAHVPYLVTRAGALTSEAFMPALRRHRMTLAMWRVLAALHENEEQTLGELLVATSLEQSTLSRTVTALRDRGLISRKASRDDARAGRVALLTRGRAMTEQIIPAAMRSHAELVEGVASADLDVFIAVLERMYANLSGATQSRTAKMRRRAVGNGDE
jgi:DNA-binding MarR family transcriptional regulator